MKRSNYQKQSEARILQLMPELALLSYVPMADFAIVSLIGKLHEIEQQQEFDIIELGLLPAHLLRCSAIRIQAQNIRKENE